MARELREHLAGVEIPQTHDAVRPCRCDGAPVGRDGHRLDGGPACLQRGLKRARLRIPQQQRAVGGAGDQQTTIRREVDALHALAGVRECGECARAIAVPELHRALLAVGGEDMRGARREGDDLRRACQRGDAFISVAGRGIPHAKRAVGAAGGVARAIGQEGDRRCRQSFAGGCGEQRVLDGIDARHALGGGGQQQGCAARRCEGQSCQCGVERGVAEARAIGKVPPLQRAVGESVGERASIRRKREAGDLAWMRLERAKRGGGGQIPDPHGAVARCTGERGAIRRERERAHGLAMALQRARAGVRGRVPDLDGTIRGAGGKRASIGRERHRTNGCAMTLEFAEQHAGAGARIPQPHGGIIAGRGQQTSIGAEGERVHAACVALEFGQRGSRVGVPESHDAVVAGGGDGARVGTACHRLRGAAVRVDHRQFGVRGGLQQPPFEAPRHVRQLQGLDRIHFLRHDVRAAARHGAGGAADRAHVGLRLQAAQRLVAVGARGFRLAPRILGTSLLEGQAVVLLRDLLALALQIQVQHADHHHADRQHREGGENGRAHHAMSLAETTHGLQHAGSACGDGFLIEIAADVVGQRAGAGVALAALLGHGLGHDHFQVAAQRGGDGGQARGVLFAHHACRLVDGLLAQVVGQASAQQLVHHHAQCVHVAADVEVMRIGVELLGAHVLHRAHQLPHIGLQGVHHHVAVGGACHAEVDHLHLTRTIHQDVGGLQVAVDHAALVSVRHGLARLLEQPHAFACAQLGVARVFGDGLRVADVFHREPRQATRAVVVTAGLVDLRDARMLQVRQHLRLELEAPKRAGAGHALAHELDGHGASWIFLLRLVDAAHAARPDQALDLIVADHGAFGHANVAAE